MVRKVSLLSLPKMLKKEDVILVDVMDEEIHQNIHIKGAVNIPYLKLEYDAIKKLDPGSVIVTYSIDYDCPVSKLAAKKLRRCGFRKVYYYPGGLQEWLEANLPVEKTESTATR